jgi:hypothetical protein
VFVAESMRMQVLIIFTFESKQMAVLMIFYRIKEEKKALDITQTLNFIHLKITPLYSESFFYLDLRLFCLDLR